MLLRKLTDKEVERIKKLKDDIKEQRQELQGAIKKQRKSIQEETKRLKGVKAKDPDMFQTLNALRDHLCDLQNRFNALPIITGIPVTIKVGDMTLCMNYELLKKFDRSLDKSDFWQYHFEIKENFLVIRYQKHGQNGNTKLYELPPDQTELLDGLPIIDLKE